MKTYLECIPCFFKQTIQACKMIGLSDDKTKAIIDKVAMKITGISMTACPPAMGRIIHSIIKEQTHNPDPYESIKKKSNELAYASYPFLKRLVKNSENSLLKAVEIAIAGNIIDYGANPDLDLNKEISSIVNSEEKRIAHEKPQYFAFSEFSHALKTTKTLLYLADNTGEIVFDKILMEEIKTLFPDIRIYCAVRGNPVINDCVISDALDVGIDTIATVISNGSDAPGTLLNICSEEFRSIWKKSDLIISKGQGNYESLSDESGNIFFMFIVKCHVLARDIHATRMDAILCRNNL